MIVKIKKRVIVSRVLQIWFPEIIINLNCHELFQRYSFQ